MLGAVQRHLPQGSRILTADARDQVVERDVKAGFDGTEVVTGGTATQTARFNHGDARSVTSDLDRDAQSGEAAADDADIHVNICGQPSNRLRLTAFNRARKGIHGVVLRRPAHLVTLSASRFRLMPHDLHERTCSARLQPIVRLRQCAV